MANLNDLFTGAAADLNAHTADTGETWTAIIGTLTLTGDGAVYSPTTGNGFGYYLSSWTPPSADYEATCYYRAVSDAGPGDGVIVRNVGESAGATPGSGYMARYNHGVGVQVYKVTGGAFNQLGSDVAATFTTGDALTLAVSGTNPTTLVVRKNGIQIGSDFTDSSSPHTAAGKGGVFGNEGETSSTGYQLDRFQLGTDTVAPPAATSYTMTGPANGPVGSASVNFTVTPVGGVYTGTITPNDGGGGGTFTPSSLTWSGTTEAKTFTYTAASAGAKTIGSGASPALTPPASISYTAFVGVERLIGPVYFPTPVGAVGYTVLNANGSEFIIRNENGVTSHDDKFFWARPVLPAVFTFVVIFDDTVRKAAVGADYGR